MRLKALSLVGIAVAMCATTAFAHHSFAMFDSSQEVTLEGTVKEFQWINPHSWIVMMVPVAEGEPAQWAIELSSPGSLAGKGWVPKTLTPGMTISVDVHPLKDGSPGGAGTGSLTLPDGKVMEF
jgi:hypothetical protein